MINRVQIDAVRWLPGDKLSLWRNIPQFVEELQWSYLACIFSGFIKFIIFLKEQAEIPHGLYL